MTVEINLVYLGVSVLVICAGILTFYIVNTLNKLNKTLEKINSLVDSNKDNIDRSMKSLPEICSNVSSITKSLKGKADLVDQYISGKEESAAALDIESLISNISSVFELLSSIKEYFSKHKKRRFKRKL